ncbi:MAG: hypothetical protein ABSH48_26495 [Verrucomicrobiota bacterium]|jgi:hypothetical protein
MLKIALVFHVAAISPYPQLHPASFVDFSGGGFSVGSHAVGGQLALEAL